MAEFIPHKIINKIECRCCSHCHKWKPLLCFSKCKSRWDGLCHTCKNCKAIQQTQYRKAHYEEYIQKRRTKYLTDIKGSDRQNEYVAKYLVEHKEEIAARRRAYKERNREEIRRKDKEYRKENSARLKEKGRQYRQTEGGKLVNRLHVIKRRTMIKNLEFSLTKQDWLDILMDQNNHCAGCGTEFSDKTTPEMDHIYPVSFGGATTKDNIQALCRSCNSSKGNKINWTYNPA